MSRLVALSALALWFGATLVLSELRWFRRLPMAERVGPFVAGGARRPSARSAFDNRSFAAILEPLATSIGARVAKVFGVSEELALRLERVGSSSTVAEFRTRQVGWAVASLAMAAAIVTVVNAPLPIVVLLACGAPLLVFLWHEQRLASASEAHQRQLFRELAVVAEQLGMLLSSGFSLTGALARVAERGTGATSNDLRRVVARIQQGLASEAALREWARVAEVDEVHQLVTILVLHHDAGDLGTLISQESRSIRREAQRRLIERIERRNEQVWIPVTVATLVPGVIFLAIPFVDALRTFGAL